MASDEKTEPASPVCYRGEGDPAYEGYLADAEVAAELRRLMSRLADGRLHAQLLAIVRELEERCRKG